MFDLLMGHGARSALPEHRERLYPPTETLR